MKCCRSHCGRVCSSAVTGIRTNLVPRRPCECTEIPRASCTARDPWERAACPPPPLLRATSTTHPERRPDRAAVGSARFCENSQATGRLSAWWRPRRTGLPPRPALPGLRARTRVDQPASATRPPRVAGAGSGGEGRAAAHGGASRSPDRRCAAGRALLHVQTRMLLPPGVHVGLGPDSRPVGNGCGQLPLVGLHGRVAGP